MPEMTGRCLCGAVRFTAHEPQAHVGACHCDMCRRWTGGPLMAVECGSRLTVDEGEDCVKAYRSSDWAERAFCAQCGSGLWYKFLPQDAFIVSAGLFDDQSDFRFTEQVFVEEKPDWYDFANKTARKTGAELAAESGVGGDEG